jgi:hypothetical protein
MYTVSKTFLTLSQGDGIANVAIYSCQPLPNSPDFVTMFSVDTTVFVCVIMYTVFAILTSQTHSV